MAKIPCFDKVKLNITGKDGKPVDIKSEFENRIKGVDDENQQREIGKQLAQEVRQQILKEHSDFKNTIGIKSEAPTPKDNSEVVNQIHQEYDQKVAEASKELPKEEKVGPTPNFHEREVGISHDRMNEIADRFGLPKYEKETQSFANWDRQAREELKKDPNVMNRIFNKFRNGEKIEPWENRATAMYVNDLEKRGNAGDIGAIGALRRLAAVTNISGRDASYTLLSRKGLAPEADPKDFAGFVLQEMALKGTDNLTPEERATVKRDYEKISGAQKAEDNAMASMREKQTKNKAEKAFQKAKSESKSATKKTKEEYAAERKAIIEEYKAKKASDTTKRQGAPITDEDVKLVAKLLKSYVEEGVETLKEAVSKIHDTAKDLIDGLTEKDVHDILAGEYNKKIPTRNEIQAKIRDIKLEAQDINKLKKMIDGNYEPKTKKESIKRSKEIEDIKSRIKEFQKEEKEANKFYGESDSGEKRIEKMQDELARLKERRAKEPSEITHREISKREADLKGEIGKERKTIADEKKAATSKENYDKKIAGMKAELQRLKDRVEKEKEPIKKRQLTDEEAKLREEINIERKAFDKENREANKFYGESDADERRMQRMEDELQRLVDRKEKEPVDREKRILSKREFDLREKIDSERKKFNAEKREANKFYGESDATKRKLEAMEDELIRLKELRAKKPSNKERKEKTPQEIKLQEQINEERKIYNKYSDEGQRKLLTSATNRIDNELKKIDELRKGLGEFAPDVKREPIHEREELKKQFPEEFKKYQEARDARLKAKEDRDVRLMQHEYNQKSEVEKNLRWWGRLAASGRVLKSSPDFSMPGRQGLWAVTSHVFEPPFKIDLKNKKVSWTGFEAQKKIRKAFGDMYKSAWSDKYFRRVMADIKESPRYEVAQKALLGIADPHSPLAEAREDIYGPSLVENIPFLGKSIEYGKADAQGNRKQIGGIIKSSERNATAFINQTKWGIYNNFVDSFEKQGKTFDNAKSDYMWAAEYANLSVGRGKIGETVEKWNTLTSKVFFSLRLQASRLRLMTMLANPKFWRSAPREVKVAYLKDMTKFVAFGMTCMYTAQKLGFQVGVNPYQSDFGKVKIGNTYYDIWGGFGQWATFLMRQTFGKTTDEGGHIKHVGEYSGGKKITRGSILLRFGRSKLSPEASVVADVAEGEDFTNTPVTPLGEVANFANPLIGSDLWQEVQADKSVKQAFLTAIFALHGGGVATYTQKPPKKRKDARDKPRVNPVRK